MLRPLSLFLLLCLLHLAGIPNASCHPNNLTASSTKSIHFLENKGQLFDEDRNPRNDIHYKLTAGNGLNVFIGNNSISYQWMRMIRNAGQDKDSLLEVCQLHVTLVGANTFAQAIPGEKQSYYENYYLAQCPNGATAYSYDKVTYKDVYPNIDWVLYVKDNQLKYDFVVHAGGNVNDIKLSYRGDSLLTLDNGIVTAYTPFGSIADDAPVSYEAETGIAVNSRFVLDGKEVGITAEAYNGTLVIDPTIRWATYCGGENADEASCIGRKYGSNLLNDLVYIAGKSNSWHNIVLNPAKITHSILPVGGQNDGNYDAFIAAYNIAGTQDWATYYGGTRNDGINAMACNKYGAIYVAGGTKSTTGLATPNTYQAAAKGALINIDAWYNDGFVAKFDTSGKLVWGSYYGGESHDELKGIALDSQENVFVAGETYSFFDIATAGTHQTSFSGGDRDAFITKLDSSGQRMWGSYYGTYADRESAGNVICDRYGNVYWSGGKFKNTDGTRLSVTPRGLVMAYDTTSFIDSAGNKVDGLIYTPGTAFKLTGEVYNTFSTGIGSIAAMNVDYHNHVLIMTGTVNPIIGTDYVFVALYNKGFFSIVDTLDGNKDDFGNALLVDYVTPNTYYVAGTTHSDQNFIQNVSGRQSLINGGNTVMTPYSDAFLAKFEPIMQTLDFVIFDTATDPVPMVKFPLQPVTERTFGVLCTGAEYFITHYSSNLKFNNGNYFTIQLSDSSGSFENYQNVGGGFGTTHRKDWYKFIVPPNIPAGNNYKMRLVSSNPLAISNESSVYIFTSPHPKALTNTPVCEGDTLFLKSTDTITNNIRFQWVKADTSFISVSQDTFIAHATPSHSGTYIVTSEVRDECYNMDTINVTVRPLPVITSIGNNSPICEGAPLQLITVVDSVGATYNWTGPGYTSTDQNPVFTNPALANEGMYYLRLTKYGCTATDSTLVQIDTTPVAPEVSGNSPICYGDSIKLNALTATPNAKYLWTGPANFSSSLRNPYILKSKDEFSGYYKATVTIGKCSSADSVMITVKELLSPPDVSSNSPVKAGDELRLYASGIAGARYNWSGPDAFISSDQNPVISNVPYTATGMYNVVATVDGCESSAMTVVVINATSEVFFVMFPNPNNGVFSIKATMKNDQVVPLEVLNSTGQSIYRQDLVSSKRLLLEKIMLPGSISNGTYYLRIRIDQAYKVVPFTVYK